MKSRSLMVFALLAAAACGGKKPAEAPAPAPAPAPIDSTAIKARMRQDSINAAEARARAAADAAARAAAQLQAQLAAELTAMIHFDFDKADIKPEDQANLDRKAAILKANPGLSIQIAGNCDNRGSDEYNLALGNRRAAAAQRYLINQGVAASQITHRVVRRGAPGQPGERRGRAGPRTGTTSSRRRPAATTSWRRSDPSDRAGPRAGDRRAGGLRPPERRAPARGAVDHHAGRQRPARFPSRRAAHPDPRAAAADQPTRWPPSRPASWPSAGRRSGSSTTCRSRCCRSRS